jgi:EpsI family protein
MARAILVAVILAATAGLTQWATRSERVAPGKPFSEFPMEVGAWEGVRSSLDADVFNVLGVEDYVLANFRNSSGEAVNLYVGFYQSQKEGDIIHSPKNCLPGAGWDITATGQETVRFGDSPAVVAKLFLQKGGSRQVVLYWFQSRGRIIASEYMQKIWLVVDSIVRGRTDGSFVRLIAPVTDDPEQAIKRLKAFARALKPSLDEHIPT